MNHSQVSTIYESLKLLYNYKRKDIRALVASKQLAYSTS